jgi:signal transduction histidine kinase
MQQRQYLLLFSAGMLAFGVMLSLFLARHQMARIKQLGVALEAVVDDQGRVQGSLGKPAGDDAIGDLGQRFTDITERLQQYNEYLELLSRRLAHELRTPVSVVRSSLENLASSVDERSLKYVQRANNGVARLTNILNSMSEASRLEQTLDHDEVIVFDLAGLVRGCFEGYEQAFPEQGFELIIECSESQITGIPELFAQMLDKLIDNAAQFSESDQPIIVRLSEETETLLVRVSNSGPGLPDTMSKELFDPMISVRDASASEDSHLGMGLYVARLIAEFHGGSIELKNREDREGVVATIKVPMLRITSKLA